MPCACSVVEAVVAFLFVRKLEVATLQVRREGGAFKDYLSLVAVEGAVGLAWREQCSEEGERGTLQMKGVGAVQLKAP